MAKTKFNVTARRPKVVGPGLLVLAALLVALIALNTIVGNLRLRRDFTQERLYTLSEGSRRILPDLPEPVTLRLYYSRSLTETPMFMKTYAQRVEDLLQEYRLAARGLITLETHDPEPDSETEEWAQRYGIEPQPTGVMTPPMYLGLVAIGASGAEQVLPVLHPRTEARLEFELTRLITRLTRPDKPVVGVLSSLPVLGTPMPPQMRMQRRSQDDGWISFRELRHDFDLRGIEPDVSSIPDDIATLMLVHPKDLSDATLFAIDQFVLRGGRLIVLVDPFCIADLENEDMDQMAMMMGMGGNAGPSDLPRLFDAWGIGYDPQRIAADINAATNLQGERGVERNPLFLSLSRENLNRDDIVSAQLDSVWLPYAGALSDRTGEDVSFVPLIQTSREGTAMVDAMNARFGLDAVRAQLQPDGLRRVLAARLSGTFTTAFPEGRPLPLDDEDHDFDATADEPTLDAGKGTIVVVADVDFLYDRFCVHMAQTMFGIRVPQLLNNNIDFLVNSVEQMSGHEDLIAIRSRGPSTRPFARVDRIEARAAIEWQEREEELNTRLQETRQRINELQSEQPGSQRLILSPAQEEAIARFREQEVGIRRQLREVRHNLRRDIERLGIRVKAVNILAIPFLVALAGLAKAWRRGKR